MFAKNERGYKLKAYVEKLSMVIATNLTSICCFYKEKIFKNNSCRRTLRQNKFRKLQYTTQIVKNQFNFKQIIQILQPIAIDYFSTHSYIVNISYYFWFCFFKIVFRWTLPSSVWTLPLILQGRDVTASIARIGIKLPQVEQIQETRVNLDFFQETLKHLNWRGEGGGSLHFRTFFCDTLNYEIQKIAYLTFAAKKNFFLISYFKVWDSGLLSLQSLFCFDKT